ncbi:aryl-alcohol dehydrogenase-like predicted oxidoreductase [Hamadaea flava]|uniref:Oxidoreductase n=1 Tax=Hamadaea flava TaxID=1742688 RepID=A0ABV8LNY4_9ACTN|nr:oxidoreductase [Hamadaea flava]MCP2322656.1 aryl-alcohol dehydrogenase-like predicted oxidoreductase [Hamadaea flava]
MVDTSAVNAADAGTWTLGDRVVNRLGFGSMRLTADPDPQAAIGLLRRAVELGVNHIDTAAYYFDAHYATELIRAALSPYPDELVITTKVGFFRDDAGDWHEANSPAALREQVEDNLRRLGRDRLDVVNLRIVRRPGRDSIAESFGALAELRAEGLIGELGISNVRVDHLDEAQAIAPVVCVQNNYAIDNHGDDELLRVCGSRGVAYVPFFAIAGSARESGATSEHSAAVAAVAARHGLSPHQVRLAWTLHQGEHVLAIPGTSDLTHLDQNVAVAGVRLTDADLAELA